MTSLKIGVGDAVKWKNHNFEFEHGVVTENADAAVDDHVLVQRLRRNAKNNTWEFVESCWEQVPLETVEQHEPINGEDSNAPLAWDRLGFRMTGPSEFVAHADEDGAEDKTVPVGDPAFEVLSDSDDSMGSLRDFIVDDDQAGVFTRAEDSGDGFVNSMHASVRAFNAWQPISDRERDLKGFIQQMEHRAAMLDDNNRVQKGMAALDYNL